MPNTNIINIVETNTDLDFKLELYADGDLMVTAPRAGYFVITAELLNRFACIHKKHIAKTAAKANRTKSAKPTPTTLAPIKLKVRNRSAKPTSKVN